MNERVKDWIQIAVLTVQTIGIVWYVSQQMQEIKDRLNFLEGQQTISRAIEDKLNTAREETNTHFATTDLKIGNLSDQLKAVLEAIRELGTGQDDGGTQTSAPPNFPQHQPTGGPPY